MHELLSAWIDAHTDEMIAQTQAILRIPSVKDADTVAADAPFGRACADALTYTLDLCARYGMATQNFDGFAGHADFGADGDVPLVAMLGHLDVVPPGTGWSVDPFGGTVQDGWFIGRGSSDDKGPTFAALFGARALLETARAEGIALPKKIRLIFGCDEESGWDCMEHYFGVAGQPKPDLAFTPDAGFPLYYAEKGAFSAVVTLDTASSPITAFHGGLRANMVPEAASATVRGDLDSRALRRRRGITAQRTAAGWLVSAAGRSAHGSTPQKGDNAVVKLARALRAAGVDAPWLDTVIAFARPDGSGVGIAGRDTVSGPLTCNIGVAQTGEEGVALTLNVRYPVTWQTDDVLRRFQATVQAAGGRTALRDPLPPLYVPRDQEPVKTLLRVYRRHTGDRRRPLTMGGRTYATAVAPNGVAFGPGRPGDPETAHQPDERFAVARLIECAKIYADALYELALC
jgi:succinyl-diaminopimelate desuccinylase